MQRFFKCVDEMMTIPKWNGTEKKLKIYKKKRKQNGNTSQQSRNKTIARNKKRPEH